MRINVLGPIEVTADGHVVRLLGPGQRTVLAELVLKQGKVVPVDRLIEVVWGNSPPPTARTKIQAHVSAFREATGRPLRDPRGPVLTIPPGYLLSAHNAVTDLAEFDVGITRGRRAVEMGEPDTASALFGDALALWRGPAFAGLRSAALRAAAAVLEERRLLAAESKAEADLETGHPDVVAGELQAWLLAYPLRERLRGLVMLALHRLGCRADALGMYRAGQQMMREELGLEPGMWISDLYDRIMADDPGLEHGPFMPIRMTSIGRA
jgi:DNA-binding SARP family transcriptional activator